MVSVTELWSTLERAMTDHAGLSPATFFTALAAALTFYYVVSRWLRTPSPPTRREMAVEEMEPLPPPVQLGEITAEELSAYDGTDPKKPLLMAIKGQIYDVTQSRVFYGPDGPYALFAGKDASRALAKMSFEKEDLTGDISGLGPFELEALQDWEYKFMGKYVKVGTVKKTVPVTDGSASETTEASTQMTEGGSIESPAAEHAVGPVKETMPETTEASTLTTEGGPIEGPAEHAVESKENSGVDISEPKEVKAEDIGELVDSKEHA